MLDLKVESTRKQQLLRDIVQAILLSLCYIFSQCIKGSLDKGNGATAFYFSVEVLR